MRTNLCLHLPFDVVPVEGLGDMAESGLARYSVLVLADLGPLAPEAVAALDGFVAGGGRLVITGRSAFDADGRAQLASMPAARVTQVTTDPHALKSVYVTERAPEEGRYYFAPVSPVFGAHCRVEAKADAQGRLVYLPQAPYGPPENCYGHAADGTPGYYLNGSGQVALIPWTVGRSYHELGLTTLRDIIVAVSRALLGDDEPVSADLDEHVEMTLQRRGDDLVVHLINLSGARRKNYGPPIRTRGGTLRLAKASDGVTAKALLLGQPALGAATATTSSSPSATSAASKSC